MIELPGTPSDALPAVLASGRTDLRSLFVSMSEREPAGRDAAYLAWHSLDHRPEQYRVAGLRHSLRLVSTPACRAARAASTPRYDAVDHVMTYFFADGAARDQFKALSDALGGGRRPFRLPSVAAGYFTVAGMAANPRAVAGADVIPWRPARGVYLLVEQGAGSPAELAQVPGVAGVWWHQAETGSGVADTQLTYCFLEDDPLEACARLQGPLEQRWQGATVPLLAAPFYTLVPYEWERYLP
jgi:hypothetical protein